MTAARPRFDPVARRTVAEEVRAALLQSIRRRELVPGSVLPTERALAEEFAVARTSVREAIQGLITLGVVERRGNRIHVTEQLPDVVLDPSDSRKSRVRDLFEVRRIVEVPIAELVATRAQPSEIEEIRAIAAEFNTGMELAEFRNLDRAFHSAVANACGNELLAELYGKVLESLFRSYEFDSLLEASGNQASVRQIIEHSSKAHQTIAEALTRGDATCAVDAVRRHLEQVESQMISRLI